jgi:hypothetical protein
MENVPSAVKEDFFKVYCDVCLISINSFGRYWPRWEDNIKMNLEGVGWDGAGMNLCRLSVGIMDRLL